MKHNDTHLHIHTNDTQTYPDTEREKKQENKLYNNCQ